MTDTNVHMIAYSKSLQALLDAADQRMQRNGGIPHEALWQQVDAEFAGDIMTPRPLTIPVVHGVRSGPTDAGQEDQWAAGGRTRPARGVITESGIFQMKERRIQVDDLMQTGYCYLLTEPAGKNFHPDFRPELTPKQMLELGVFGGKYMTDCINEFPADWFENARLCSERHDPDLNFFGVNASQSLSEWQRKGWIYHEDPRGWFQWYCRYYMGRRCADDERQIKRWRAMRRHVAQIQSNCRKGDLNCRRKQRQALLHWGYDSRNL